MNSKTYRTRTAIIAFLIAMLWLPVTAQAASPEVEEIMQRYEQEKKEREAKWAEAERLEKLDKAQVEKDLTAYRFPIEQSRCGDFVVDWSQVTTVQQYIQMSLSHARSLGNCLHAETKSNAETLAKYMKDSNIGETRWSWNDNGFPDSIDSMSAFANLKGNHDRCSLRCFDLFNGLLDKAAGISLVKRDMFLAKWDDYTENTIKPAMKAQDPAGYEQNNLEQEFANIRSALKHFAYKANEPESP